MMEAVSTFETSHGPTLQKNSSSAQFIFFIIVFAKNEAIETLIKQRTSIKSK
jgi:hypothetical protein